MIGFERQRPEHPGVLLEQPVPFVTTNRSQPAYFRTNQVKQRFEGKIYYMLLLDSCEDIHTPSLATFKQFIESQLVVE